MVQVGSLMNQPKLDIIDNSRTASDISTRASKHAHSTQGQKWATTLQRIPHPMLMQHVSQARIQHHSPLVSHQLYAESIIEQSVLSLTWLQASHVHWTPSRRRWASSGTQSGQRLAGIPCRIPNPTPATAADPLPPLVLVEGQQLGW